MKNKSTACWCQGSASGCLIEGKMSKSKKGHNSEKNAFLIVSLMDCSLDSDHII